MPKIPQPNNNELAGYNECLRELRIRISSTQIRAGLAVNHELVLLYWHIGHEILKRQKNEGWGAKVIDQLSIGLRHAFPDMTGLSFRNLKYMRAFAEAWSDSERDNGLPVCCSFKRHFLDVLIFWGGIIKHAH